MKCKNRRCNRELQEDFIYCPYCGKNQAEEIKRSTKRANGTGSIYYRKDNKKHPWQAASTITGRRVYIGTFSTKTEAQRALTEYEYNPSTAFSITFEEVYKKWINTKGYKKLSKSSKSGYTAAWIKCKRLYKRKLREIKTYDMQEIIDYYENPHHEYGANGQLKYIDNKGNVTMKKTDKPKMCDGLGYSALHTLKIFLSKLFTFALKEDIVNKNYATYIELPPQEEVNATAFSDVQLELIRQNIGRIDYLDYAYALCYLNFRISEFLDLTSNDYYVDEETGIPILIGGKKTKAGKNRLIPIHPKIQDIVKDCIARNGETIFCKYDDGTPMNKDSFLRSCFRPAMQAIGIPDTYTPHSCRRTFSTRMSAAGAREEDIIALMGHTDYKVDIKHYIKQEAETLYKAIQKMA